MTLEMFSKYLNAFRDKRAAAEDWLEDVHKAFYGAWEAIMEHDYQELFLQLFTEVMNDTDHWLDYFIYDCEGEWFEVYFDHDGAVYEVEIDSEEKLYNLINGNITWEQGHEVESVKPLIRWG